MDADRVLDTRLFRTNSGWEPAGQGWRPYSIDICGIFIQRRGRRTQCNFTPRQRRLDQCCASNRAIDLPATDQRMHSRRLNRMIFGPRPPVTSFAPALRPFLEFAANICAPAITSPMSSAISRLLRSFSGTSPSDVCAGPNPSCDSRVLPVPGSPVSDRVFLGQGATAPAGAADIPSSRPMIGSESCPDLARFGQILPFIS